MKRLLVIVILSFICYRTSWGGSNIDTTFKGVYRTDEITLILGDYDTDAKSGLARIVIKGGDVLVGDYVILERSGERYCEIDIDGFADHLYKLNTYQYHQDEKVVDALCYMEKDGDGEVVIQYLDYETTFEVVSGGPLNFVNNL